MPVVDINVLHEWCGNPVVLLDIVDPRDNKHYEFTFEQLPANIQQIVFNFLQNHLPAGV